MPDDEGDSDESGGGGGGGDAAPLLETEDTIDEVEEGVEVATAVRLGVIDSVAHR